MNKIPTELKEIICNNDLILFVGAGLSYNLTNIKKVQLKGWSNLVHCILTELINKGFDVKELLPLVQKYDPIKVLDLIESNKGIPKKEIYSFAKDFFDLDHNNDVKLHKLLFQLSNKIITTNYDNAFEIAVPELRKNKAYKGKNYELTTHKDPNSILLFKLHGCFEDVDSMVLFPSNYRSLYENSEKDAEHSLLVLRNIIVNKSILFIGTGMGDFQINNIFREIKKIQGEYNQNHFIITNKELDSSLNFITPIKINNYTEIYSVVESLITLKDEFNSTDKTEILELKKQLKEANKRIDELENTSDKDKLLERESLKYFTKGLILSLANEPILASEEYKIALELKPDLHQAIYNWGTDLGELAQTKEGKEVEDLSNQAFDKFQKVIELKPDKHEAYNNWGNTLGHLANTKKGKEAEDLYNQAFDKFQKAIEIKPDKHEAFNNWGIALGNLAQSKEDKETEDLFNQAIGKFQKAIEIKPDKYSALENWGIALGKLALTKYGEEAENLYKEAIDKFQKVIEIKPNNHVALEGLGNYLGKIALSKQGKEAEQLYAQAFDSFQKSIEISPNEYEVFIQWGIYLVDLAIIKDKKASEDLCYEAIVKFKKAIEINPIRHEAFEQWGITFTKLAQAKEGKEAKDFYDQAIEKLKKAIDYGAKTYNLSCLFALRADKEKALKYLETSLLNNEITAAFVANDKDWEAYLEETEFIELLNKYKR